MIIDMTNRMTNTITPNRNMVPGYYAKLARSRRLIARMNAAWDNGGFVRIGTATRYTDYKVKHRDMIVMGNEGTLFVKAGKRLDCIDYCSFQFSA